MEVLGVFALIALGYGIRSYVQYRRDSKAARGSGGGGGGGGRPGAPDVRTDAQ